MTDKLTKSTLDSMFDSLWNTSGITPTVYEVHPSEMIHVQLYAVTRFGTEYIVGYIEHYQKPVVGERVYYKQVPWDVEEVSEISRGAFRCKVI